MKFRSTLIPFFSVVLGLNKKLVAMMEPSSYISNMMLPELVQATRDQPLGPDCIISQREVTDRHILWVTLPN